MKISRKLLISNIVINIIAMITMSIIISAIVSNYIKKDIADDLIKENDIFVRLFNYKRFFDYRDGELKLDSIFYKYKPSTSILYNVFVINDNKSPKLLIKSYNGMNVLSKDEISQIISEESNKVYDITINDKLYLAYNNKIDIDFFGKKFTILVITFIPNLLIKQVIVSIIIVLIASILIISFLSLIITSYMGRKITKPIERLKEVTEKISNKDFDVKAEINTGDELESLATSVNNMAERIKKNEIEQKKFYENVSHELKTPVTVISGYAEGLKANIFDDNQKALDTIIEESAQLKKQLENIIYLSKLDTINDIFNYEESSINNVISNSIKKVDSIVILNDIDIIYNPIKDVILSIDKEKIIRMLINILSNCIKYTKDTIKIKTVVKEGYYKVVISDNGNGFNEKILLNPFGRLKVGEKEGSGIGLSIVKKIIDGHNGKIMLANNKNGGAIYTIEIPIK